MLVCWFFVFCLSACEVEFGLTSCEVELEKAETTSTSRSSRTTRSESFASYQSSDSVLSVLRSGLLTFFSSLVIQESLINCAGERLRSKTDSHCESVFCVCLSASYPIHNPRQELQSILREKGLSYKYPLPCLLHNASAMLQGYTQ